MKQPLVSVILPTYNRLAFLRLALESVLNQDYAPLEVIVVDDGSTDATPAYMATLDDTRVRYLYFANQGPAAARNAGIGAARGAYLALIDSDDLWCPGKLAAQVAYLERHPAVGMLATNFKYFETSAGTLCDPAQPFGYAAGPRFLQDILECRFPMAPSTVMLRGATLARVGGFNEQLRIAEDLDLWVRIGLDSEVAYLDQVYTAVRLHEQHLMRATPRHQVWLDSVRVLESHRGRLAGRIRALERQYAGFYARAGNAALLAGRRRTALACYWRALARAPWSWRRPKDLLRCALPLRYLRHRAHGGGAGHPILSLYR